MTSERDTQVEQIPLHKLRADEQYQPRMNGLSERYIQLLLASDPGEWPPLMVSPNGAGGYYIIDGFHRYEAARRLGLKEVRCVVQEAAGYPEAFEANLRHGLPLSLEDRKAYARWLYHNALPRGQSLSYREIARRSGLSDKTVKAAIEGDAENPQSNRVQRDPIDRLLTAIDRTVYYNGQIPSASTIAAYIELFDEQYRLDVAGSFAKFGRSLIDAGEPYLRSLKGGRG